MDSCDERLFRQLSRKHSLGGLSSILEAIGKSPAHVEGCGGSEGFRQDSLHTVKVGVFSKKVSSRSRRMLEAALPYIRNCCDGFKLLEDVFRKSEATSLAEYLVSAYGERWREQNEVSDEDMARILEPEKDNYTAVPDLDDMIGDVYIFDLFKEKGCSKVRSSNYWEAYESHSFGVNSYTFDFSRGSLDAWGCRESFATGLLQSISRNPNPKKTYAGYYDLVCGKPVERLNSVAFKLVAKRNDCSPEELQLIAVHYLKNCLYFDDDHVDVEIDYDSVSVSGIHFVTEECDFASWEPSLIDAVDWVKDDSLGLEVPHITYVQFRCFFKNTLRLKVRTVDSVDYSFYGKNLDFSFGIDEGLFQILRDAFENPRKVFFSDGNLLWDPTKESVLEVRMNSVFTGEYSLILVARIVGSFGNREEQNRLQILMESMDGMLDGKRFPVEFLYEPPGDDGLERVLTSINYLERCEMAGQSLLEQWGILENPAKLFELVRSAVCQDPVFYADSKVGEIAAYARALI